MAPRPSVATVAVGVGYAGFVGVLALWWTGGTPLSSAASRLVDYGRLAGLLAAYLVVVQLTLRARIPWLERGVETHRLARWHRYGGQCLVVLAVAHALLILWGYAGLSAQPLVSQANTLVLSYPDVLMATVALGLLLLVAVISTRAIRRRLRYETWFHLHLYVYLALALAISHQLVNGERFATNRTARWCWLGLYAAAAAALLWYRVITPLRRFYRHRLLGGVGVATVGRHDVGRHLRSRPRAARYPAGAVFPLAVPHPGPVVVGQPVLTLGVAVR